MLFSVNHVPYRGNQKKKVFRDNCLYPYTVLDANAGSNQSIKKFIALKVNSRKIL